MLNGEISKRDCEIYTLQSRLEMTDKQHQDQTHHINVLKEQVKTREHKISMLTADVSPKIVVTVPSGRSFVPSSVFHDLFVRLPVSVFPECIIIHLISG